MNQSIIDRAVKIATSYAIQGTPVERIIWLEPQSACDNPDGSFGIKLCDFSEYSVCDKMPWEE